MKRVVLILILLFSVKCFAQKKRANVWYFGKYAGLDFSATTPSVLLNNAMTNLEGTASISDTSGNLLFYTNGVNVWNKFHAIMPNGTGLTGDPSSAQTIIIPKPKSNNLFYIFYADDYGGPNGLRYSEVDMQLYSGTGNVNYATRNTLLHLNASEKITAVNHCNDTDVWVMTVNYATDEFFAYLVTQSGISPPVKSNSKPDEGFCCNSMKFSPDGKWLAYTNNVTAGGDDSQLFTFDNQTGLATFKNTLPRVVPLSEIIWGLSFSPGSTKLYLTSVYNNDPLGVYTRLYQYDLTATNIPNSKTEILRETFLGSGVSQHPFCQLQNAPNGKIYFSRWGQGPDLDTLGVINSPDSPGLSCNPVLSAVPLSGRSSLIGLPNYNESYFDLSSNSNATCTATVSLKDQQNISSKKISVYPNPATEYIYFESDAAGELNIYDLFGDIVQTLSITEKTQKIQFSGLSNGFYFWRFKTKHTTEKGRVLICRNN